MLTATKCAKTVVVDHRFRNSSLLVAMIFCKLVLTGFAVDAVAQSGLCSVHAHDGYLAYNEIHTVAGDMIPC